FKKISIYVETVSLSISMISLTIALLCMLNVRYIVRLYLLCFQIPLHFSHTNKRLTNKSFRRLHVPRNILHMNLFVAFILRCIIKLIFIHLIIGGYTYPMVTYITDKCGNIEVQTKSTKFGHVFGCRLLASLYWYTDAISNTFVFCEAMFLFTALTIHVFRESRGIVPYVLYGWLSPIIWVACWTISHWFADRRRHRTTCWLEYDQTAVYYYFFWVPYVFYMLLNFAVFLFLVRLLYSKYQSNTMQTNRSGNRHLIKSILILIPLFGLHSIFVMWIFYRHDKGYTIWTYIAIMFKAVFGDLQGFFTSLIYFYFNTEIRQEVLRQLQRTTWISSTDNVRRSSGETFSTRLSTFRMSFTRRHRASSKDKGAKKELKVNYQHPELEQRHPEPTVSHPLRRRSWLEKLNIFCNCPSREPTSRNDQPKLEHQQQHGPEHDDLVVPLLTNQQIGIEPDVQTCDTLMRLDDDITRQETNDDDVTMEYETTTDENVQSSQQQSSHPSFIRDKSNSDSYIASSNEPEIKHPLKRMSDTKSLQ
ncbi:unnamed protein product, partial [Didymodactylos carnosus]